MAVNNRLKKFVGFVRVPITIMATDRREALDMQADLIKNLSYSRFYTGSSAEIGRPRKDTLKQERPVSRRELKEFMPKKKLSIETKGGE